MRGNILRLVFNADKGSSPKYKISIYVVKENYNLGKSLQLGLFASAWRFPTWCMVFRWALRVNLLVKSPFHIFQRTIVTSVVLAFWTWRRGVGIKATRIRTDAASPFCLIVVFWLLAGRHFELLNEIKSRGGLEVKMLTSPLSKWVDDVDCTMGQSKNYIHILYYHARSLGGSVIPRKSISDRPGLMGFGYSVTAPFWCQCLFQHSNI
jgi:hypothetical protein